MSDVRLPRRCKTPPTHGRLPRSLPDWATLTPSSSSQLHSPYAVPPTHRQPPNSPHDSTTPTPPSDGRPSMPYAAPPTHRRLPNSPHDSTQTLKPMSGRLPRHHCLSSRSHMGLGSAAHACLIVGGRPPISSADTSTQHSLRSRRRRTMRCPRPIVPHGARRWPRSPGPSLADQVDVRRRPQHLLSPS